MHETEINLNLKIIHLPETEILNVALENSWNHIKHTEVNLFLANLGHLEPPWVTKDNQLLDSDCAVVIKSIWLNPHPPHINNF